jgi:hypothetical protein
MAGGIFRISLQVSLLFTPGDMRKRTPGALSALAHELRAKLCRVRNWMRKKKEAFYNGGSQKKPWALIPKWDAILDDLGDPPF